MAKKVVLINVNTCISPYPVFPLGLAHLVSALEAAGYRAHILDLALDDRELAQRLARIKPSYIGLSLRNIDDIHIVDTQFYAGILQKTARRIRSLTNAAIVVGGSGYSLFPDILLEETGADFGIAGEAEHSFVTLLNCLENQTSYHAVPGLVYRENGAHIINPKAPFPADKIPSPKYERRLAKHYLATSTMLNIQTQRGCGFKCSYCTYPLIEGKRFRRRSAQQVCDDLAAAEKAGARYVFIVDSVFNTSPEHVSDVCEEILRRNIRMRWGCFLRPKGISLKLMETMARAGLVHIEFGTDSLSNAMLENYEKGFTVDDVVQTSDYARKAQIYFAHFLIFGGPGETEKTINEGFANSKRISRTVFFPFVGVRIYPRTKVHALALAQGVISKKTDLLSPVFYVTPHVSRRKILSLLSRFRKKRPNWIIDDMTKTHGDILNGLRKIGITGPMWEYLIR